jgi:hypothetical protein
MPLLLALLLAVDLHAVEKAEVVIVTGSADHMEQVMRRAGAKFAVVAPEDLPNLPLRWQQVLMVNCTGEMSAPARERVRRFVNAGGMLYTTDHAVKHLIEPLFPGTIRFNGKSTQEEIFPTEVQGDRGLLAKIGDEGHQTRWQLAGGGMLFDVLDPKKVEVLIRSPRVAERYRSSGVLAVRFHVGDGQVVHASGHFFTQPGQAPSVAAAGRAFEQLSQNVVQEKKDDAPRVEKLYSSELTEPVELRGGESAAAGAAMAPSGAPVRAKAAAKVRVLQRRGDQVEVRDEEGNQGWVGAAQVK